MKIILRRTAYLLITAAVVASNLVLNRATIVCAEAVRQIPTRIDGASTPADITIEGFLSGVVGSGDFNGDGADDFLVQYNKGLGVPGAIVFEKFGIIFGKRNQNQPIKIDLATDAPDLSLTTEVKGALGSSQIAALGDLNEDGIDDIALSHRVPSGSNWPVDLVVKVFFGSSSLTAGVLDLDTLPPDLKVHIAEQLVYFAGVAGVADMNGDGIKDLLLTENYNYNYFNLPILFGPFTPGETRDFVTRRPDVIIKGNNDVEFINSVSLADVNGDGITDVLIRTPGTFNPFTVNSPREVSPDTVSIVDRLQVILGSPDLKLRPEIDLSKSQADASISAGSPSTPIATGDVNDDGAADVLLGFSGARSAEPAGFPWSGGSVSITFGFRSLRGRVDQSDASILGGPRPTGFQPIAGKTLGERLGASVAVSDINGDGVSDILIGAPGITSDENGMEKPLSRAHVILGSSAIKSGTNIETEREQQDITISFDSKKSGVGSRVASGDFNGDGFGDILVGNDSVIYVFFGGPLRSPEITKAKYRKSASELLVFGTDLTGSARVEINGLLIDREVTFEREQGRLVLEGLKSDLNLRDGKNQIVVVRKGARSNRIKLKL